MVKVKILIEFKISNRDPIVWLSYVQCYVQLGCLHKGLLASLLVQITLDQNQITKK